MKYAFPLAAVVALILIPLIGVQLPGMQYLFGVLVPYAALIVFVVGVIRRARWWGKSPVPFRIPTTCGQEYSLPWIKQDKLENPVNAGQVLARMFLEIVCFRSLWRNTKATVYEGPKLTYESSKWLWLFGIVFHYSFLVVIVRHLRLFLDPTPPCVAWLETLDSLLQVGAPLMYITDLTLLAALTLLFLRRIWNPHVRYLSLANDYFPLFLLLAIAGTGVFMRYCHRDNVDIEAIKGLAVGLATFRPVIAGKISAVFYAHLFLVCVLLAYFPYSKLMHMGGVFFSPTRNLANNSRMKRHINPWNPDIKPHSYASYEDEFREDMVEQGIPVDKPLPPKDEAAPEPA